MAITITGVTSTQGGVDQKPIHGHAENLHNLASRLSKLNDELYSALNRLVGEPAPDSGASQNAEQPAPQGALMIAQFGAERIRQQLEYLEKQIVRLDSAV